MLKKAFSQRISSLLKSPDRSRPISLTGKKFPLKPELEDNESQEVDFDDYQTQGIRASHKHR